MSGAGPTLTLRDVADLAGVQRPVVSMWRRRQLINGEPMPFPAPVATADGVERFRRDEIVDWLERTGRGNNAEQRLDAPALTVPAGISLEELVTLLCLHSYGDGDLADTTPAQRESLAAQADPDDEFLLTEVRAADPTPEILRFIDELVEASFGLPEALTRLEQGPAGRALGRRDLTVEAVSLVRAVVRACGLHLDPDGVPLMYAGGPSSLVLSVADGFSRLVVPGDAPVERALRRRARIHDLEVSTDIPGASVRVLSVLGQEPEGALDGLDELVLDLGPGDVGVALGPASLLCDRLRGDAERRRAHTLRSGGLVAAMRLPRGLWREAHRQALGLWICVGGHATDRPLVSDLGAVSADDLSTDDVAADVAGALAGGHGRSFRYLRAADLPRILSGSPIVVPGVRALRWGTTTSDSHLDRIQAAAMVTAEPPPAFDILVTVAPGAILLRQRSLGELRDSGLAQVRRGCRVDRDHATPEGSVPVLSGDGATDGLVLDPFDVQQYYPRAHRTEAGDVVFIEGPSPRARVDERGGSLVASPSRILRLDARAGIGPHTVAAIINYHPVGTREWQTWNIPLLDPAVAEELEKVLAGAAAYATSLLRRQEAARELITALIDGVAAGTVSVTPRITVLEGQR